MSRYILSGDLTTNKLQEILQNFSINDRKRYNNYYNYFLGKQKITEKTYKDPSKPCNKVVVNFCNQIVQQYLGFNIGIPVTYEVPDEIQFVLNYNDVTEKDNLLLRNALIFGKSFELEYIDSDKMKRFDIIDTRFGIDIYSDEIQQDELKYFIRMYCVDNTKDSSDNWRIEVYDKSNIYTYKCDSMFTNLSLIDTAEHYFGQVPVNVFSLNEEEQSIFSQVMSLQDSYNTLISSEIDDWEAFVDAYLVLKGVSASEEDINAMKTNRVIILDNDNSAEYLTKDVNNTQIKDMMSNIKDMIFKMSNAPDFSDPTFMSQSGIALQYKLTGFNNVSKAIMNRMEKVLRKRIELFENVDKLINGNTGYVDVGITFTQNIPANIVESAQVVNSLRGLVSNRTLLSLLPFVSDVDEEIKQLEKENQVSMSLYGFGNTQQNTEDDSDE